MFFKKSEPRRFSAAIPLVDTHGSDENDHVYGMYVTICHVKIKNWEGTFTIRRRSRRDRPTLIPKIKFYKTPPFVSLVEKKHANNQKFSF